MSYRIATVRGIPLELHLSLVIAALWLISQFGWITGLFIQLCLLVSIALHELGHSLVGMRLGCRVRRIVLTFIGGAAQMEHIPSRPLGEFLMAAAGPAVSLLLGLTGLLGGAYFPRLELPDSKFNPFMILGVLNIGLLLFNLLPAFPMDGGRILRAVLTPRFGRLQATIFAARLGRILAVLMGIRAFFPFNLFLLAIAFFVFTAAGQEELAVRIQEATRQGHPFAPLFNLFTTPEPPVAPDQVEVSPPPFRRGRRERVDLEVDDSPP